MNTYALTILYWRNAEIIQAESPRNARRKFRKMHPHAIIVSCDLVP